VQATVRCSSLGLDHHKRLWCKIALHEDESNASVKRIRFQPHNLKERIKNSLNEAPSDLVRLGVREDLAEKFISLSSGVVSCVSQNCLLGIRRVRNVELRAVARSLQNIDRRHVRVKVELLTAHHSQVCLELVQKLVGP